MSIRLLYGERAGDPDGRVVITTYGDDLIGPLFRAKEDVEGLLQWLGWKEDSRGMWSGGYDPHTIREWNQLRELWAPLSKWKVCKVDGCYGRLPPGWRGEMCDQCTRKGVKA